MRSTPRCMDDWPGNHCGPPSLRSAASVERSSSRPASQLNAPFRDPCAERISASTPRIRASTSSGVRCRHVVNAPQVDPRLAPLAEPQHVVWNQRGRRQLPKTRSRPAAAATAGSASGRAPPRGRTRSGTPRRPGRGRHREGWALLLRHFCFPGRVWARHPGPRGRGLGDRMVA